MRDKLNIVKRFILIGIFILVFFPILQNQLHFFIVKKLKGDFNYASNINFSFEVWFSGDFQENEEKFLNENFGLRNTLIRVNNQLRFNLFEKSTNREAVFGKDGYIFAEDYINSYTGENYIGIDSIIRKSKRVKELQLKLSEKGIVFLPIFAPNKARVLSDFLPSDVYVKNYTNYEAFIKCFNKYNITHIDFNDYFIKTIKSSKYPLYSKYGIHWSSYGHTMVADSIINFVNYKYGLQTPKMEWKDKIELSDSLREMDYDIGDAMNLFIDQLPSLPLAYPKPIYIHKENNKPSLLVIGDSFFEGIEITHMQNEAFSNYKFLYYFNELRPYSDDPDAFYKLKIKDEIFNHKIIILIMTEHSLPKYGWGFIEKALNIIDGKDDGTADEELYKLIEMTRKIEKDNIWMKKIRIQAEEKNKSLDSMIYINAKYMIDLEKSQ